MGEQVTIEVWFHSGKGEERDVLDAQVEAFNLQRKQARQTIWELAIHREAVGMGRNFEILRQRVDDRHADAMQSAGNLVRVIIEFSAGMQFRHNHFDRRYIFFFMNTDRNSTAIIQHTDAVVRVNGHFNLIAKTGHGFIDAVIDDFIYQMMQGFHIGAADIHPRSATYSFQPFKNLNAAGIIFCF